MTTAQELPSVVDPLGDPLLGPAPVAPAPTPTRAPARRGRRRPDAPALRAVPALPDAAPPDAALPDAALPVPDLDRPDSPAPADTPVPVEPPLALPRNGEPPMTSAAFEGCVATLTPRLVRVAYRRLRDHGDAEEVAQETLLRAYQHRTLFSAPGEVAAWTTVVASRLAIDRSRARRHAVAVADVPEPAAVSADAADIAVAKAEVRLALQALEALPTRQAQVVWAREVEGLHYQDICDRLGLSEATVRSLLHRGRKALRRQYAARGGATPLGAVLLFGPWLSPLRRLRRLHLAAGASAAGLLVGLAGLGVLLLPGSGDPVTVQLGRPVAASATPAGALTPRPTAPTAGRTGGVAAGGATAGATAAAAERLHGAAHPAALPLTRPVLCSRVLSVSCASPHAGSDTLLITAPRLLTGPGSPVPAHLRVTVQPGTCAVVPGAGPTVHCQSASGSGNAPATGPGRRLP